ncbi:HNH endonuclease signature motif containing protein [uncultured Mameliella sp.]|uniref:HNH endonuclease n=1 Tax=uncultured Mameliella sp. TaxID=1447087 RepID=UPI002616A82B|nr:HNH endonuclease signature motif containing protein [uncultured Mameliella sp.]
MARLKPMSSGLTSLATRLSHLDQTRDQARGAVKRSRAWYNSKRWQEMRRQVLQDAGFTCARCGFASLEKWGLVADHIEPHREDEARFWDRENLQCLCWTCHSRDKQREEVASGR